MAPRLPARLRRGRAAGALLALTLLLAWLPSGTADAAPGPTLVVSNLDNPRGLVFGKHGELYVGEAGHAGPTCTAAEGEEGPLCIGFTSRISSLNVSKGTRTTVAGGFPSIGTAVGATGIDGVAFNREKVYGIITGSPRGVPPGVCEGAEEPACSDAVAGASRKLGDLVRVQGSSGSSRTDAEVGTFNYDWIVAHKDALDPNNPDFQPGDSNPYGITAGPDGGFYVADAGSNTVTWVDKQGRVSELAYLPNPPGPPGFPYDAVPTCVATAGSAVWIGTLSGQVYRWTGSGQPQLVAGRDDGLTAINGCGTDAAGNLYVSNIFGLTDETFFAPHTGFVSKVTSGGDVTTVAGSEGMSYPAGIAVSGSALYVAVQSICPADLSLAGEGPCDAPGQVVRLTL
jgi:hypothetical protein